MSNSKGTVMYVSGRIVWKSGDLFKGQQQKDMFTGIPKVDKFGKASIQYGFGLAVPKIVNNQPNPQLAEIMTKIDGEAIQLYQNGHIPPAFARKFKDGDGIDDKGISFAVRDGYKEHYVFSCTQFIPIAWCKYENGGNILINEGVKVGDYVCVNLSMKAHPAMGQGKAGMYLNPIGVQLTGYGDEIVSTKTASPDTMFGNLAPQVPYGASSVPLSQGNFAPPQQQYQQAPQQQAAPVPAHYGVLPQVHQPQYQQQQQMVPPVQAPQQQGAPIPNFPQGFPQQR